MHNYEVNLSWLENRKGTISSPALTQSIEIATPPEFPKGIKGIWSPEHLFVAAIESCLMTTFLAVAENSKLEFASLNTTAIGKLDKVDGKYMMTEVILRPTLVINDPELMDKAKRVLAMSEKACLISNSVKSAIIFEPVIKVE
ncbi:MAG: OsmC family peroxiredoxin [Chitinophagaceae bacterium]|nr:OsmC family peroxiredoxin [Chitinophagaceae bacterium]